MSDSYSREYKGYYVTYSDGKVKVYNSELSDVPLKESNCNIKDEKDFEVEIMWLVDEYERTQIVSSDYYDE